MALNLDPKLGQEASAAIVAALSGEAQDVLVNLFNVARSIGEDNSTVDHVVTTMKEFENWFNNELAPLANKLKDHFAQHSELAAYFNSLEYGTVTAGEDLGQVADANYDAASDL